MQRAGERVKVNCDFCGGTGEIDSVIVPGLDMLHHLVDNVPDVFRAIYEKLLPGRFTFLFKVSKSIDPALVKESDKIGIRIPNVPNILKLVEILKVPLISTSVNRFGEPP